MSVKIVNMKAKSARLAYIGTLFVFFLFVICRNVISEEQGIPNKEQLVAFYQATAQNSLFQRDRWFIEVSDQTTIEGAIPKTASQKLMTKYTVYKDRERIDSRNETTYFSEENERIVKKRFQYITLDGCYYCYDRAVREGDYPWTVIATNEINQPRRLLNSAGNTMLALAGYMHGDLKPLADILAEESSVLKMLPLMQIVNGFPTYVLEATTPYGHYTVWMDPNCGYSPRRVIVERGPKDLYDGKPVSTPRPVSQHNAHLSPRPTRERARFELEISKIEQVGDCLIATQGTGNITETFSDGSIEKCNTECECTFVDPSPDFNDIPNAFVLDVPNGTPVSNVDFPAGRFKWQNGKMVSDIDGLVIEQLDDTAEEIMKEKALPSGLGSIENTVISNKEPNVVVGTQTELAESQSEVLAESHGLSIVVLIPIGLLIIGVIGLLMFRHLRAYG